MDFDSLGVEAAALAGPLEARLQAMGRLGFHRAVLNAEDLSGHSLGIEAAVRAVRQSGIRIPALTGLEDFEGLQGPSHDYKVHVAQDLLRLCRQLGAQMLVVSASTAAGGGQDPDGAARDLSKLATLAVPMGVRIAYRPRPGSPVAPNLARAAELVSAVNRANLGLALDSGDLLARPEGLEDLDYCYPDQVFLVGLSDYISLAGESARPAGGPGTPEGCGIQVFPGAGTRGTLLVELVTRLESLGFYGDFYLAGCNSDHARLPPVCVAERAHGARLWLQRRLRNTGLPRRKVAVGPNR